MYFIVLEGKEFFWLGKLFLTENLNHEKGRNNENKHHAKRKKRVRKEKEEKRSGKDREQQKGKHVFHSVGR